VDANIRQATTIKIVVEGTSTTKQIRERTKKRRLSKSIDARHLVCWLVVEGGTQACEQNPTR
ncbi:MAG: hypothetical protein QXI60_10020, partial [Thermofilaceae archaeon]